MLQKVLPDNIPKNINSFVILPWVHVRNWKHSTVSAKDGFEVLKLVFKEKPDLIITDFIMPKMDGVALIKKLKSRLATRYIPIIMLTAKDEVESEVVGMEAGADDYLTKPVNRKRLLTRINRLLKKPQNTDV